MKHAECPYTDKQVALFLSKLEPCENGCIVWTGCANASGYGTVTIGQKQRPAHRVAYEIANGPIPPGLVIRHKCDFPPCCNHEHLQTGTHKQNSEDMVRRGRCNAPRGERAGNHRLTREIVIQIKTDIIAGVMTQMDLARKYNVSKNTINSIRLGWSWAHVPPFIPQEIPHPHRKYTDQDHLDIRQKWRDGWKLKQIAAEYDCRIDTVQAIIKGKRGKRTPVGELANRFHQPKLTDDQMVVVFYRYLNGERLEDLWNEFGVSKNTMRTRIAHIRAKMELKKAA